MMAGSDWKIRPHCESNHLTPTSVDFSDKMPFYHVSMIDCDGSFLDEVHRTAQPDYVPTTGQFMTLRWASIYPLIPKILQMIF